jgi:uncharacterized membrane protein YhhN
VTPLASALSAGALTAVFVTGYLVASWKRAKTWCWVCKPAASLVFIALSFLLEPRAPDLALWLRVGLVLSAVGDVALLDRGRKGLAIGMGAFLLGHVAYCVGLAPRVPLSLVTLIVTALALAAGGWVFWTIREHLGPLYVPAALYTVAVAATCATTVSAWAATPREVGAILFGLGGFLFFVSDVSVAWLRFLKAPFVHRVWGLPCYYAGQVLIATSIAYAT